MLSYATGIRRQHSIPPQLAALPDLPTCTACTCAQRRSPALLRLHEHVDCLPCRCRMWNILDLVTNHVGEPHEGCSASHQRMHGSFAVPLTSPCRFRLGSGCARGRAAGSLIHTLAQHGCMHGVLVKGAAASPQCGAGAAGW